MKLFKNAKKNFFGCLSAVGEKKMSGAYKFFQMPYTDAPCPIATHPSFKCIFLAVFITLFCQKSKIMNVWFLLYLLNQNWTKRVKIKSFN